MYELLPVVQLSQFEENLSEERKNESSIVNCARESGPFA